MVQNKMQLCNQWWQCTVTPRSDGTVSRQFSIPPHPFSNPHPKEEVAEITGQNCHHFSGELYSKENTVHLRACEHQDQVFNFKKSNMSQ